MGGIGGVHDHMSRGFVRTGEYLSQHSAPVLSAYPVTMAAWFKSSDTTNSQGVVALCDSSGGLGRKLLYLSAGAVTYYNQNDAAGFANISAGAFSSGAWTHAAAVSASATDHRVFRAGGNKATSSTSVAFGTPSGCRVGADDSGNDMSGSIAWPAIWDVALSDVEIAALGAGAHPLSIRPSALVAYWPLTGDSTGGEVDLIGGFNLSETGTVDSGESPAVSLGWPVIVTGSGVVVGGAVGGALWSSIFRPGSRVAA